MSHFDEGDEGVGEGSRPTITHLCLYKPQFTKKKYAIDRNKPKKVFAI